MLLYKQVRDLCQNSLKDVQLLAQINSQTKAKYDLDKETRDGLTRYLQMIDNAKKQGMASLVIQKSLLSWWIQNKNLENTRNSAKSNEEAMKMD